MRILYFADTRFPIERANGIQTMATCHALAEHGHDVHLIVRPDTASPPRDPFSYYGLPATGRLTISAIGGLAHAPTRRAQFLLAAARRMIHSRPDVAYTRDLGLAALLLQIPSAGRPPIIYESHGIAPVVASEMPMLLGKPELTPTAAKLRRLDRRERRVWRRADAYVTITQALVDELTARYGAGSRVFVAPDGVTLGTSAPTPPSNRSVPLAAYAGHLYPWKGVDVFVRALALAPEVHGLIVGGHPQESDFARVEGLVRELRLTSRVKLTGQVGPTDVRQRLTEATMLVLPNTASAISERYTSPLKLFEYLTMGRPIVASDLPAIREIIRHDTEALLVPAGNTGAMAEAMRRLAADEALSARLGQAALAVAPSYSWARRAERLEPALLAAANR